MFGRRKDGRLVTKGIDPITRLTPFIMTERSDAQCYCTQYADADILQNYVRDKRAQGIRMSQMEVIIAAYVRAVAHMPEINRFVVGKKVYARNELCVSFAMVKIRGKDDFLETTVKVYFDPATDTVLDVARKVEDTIERNRVILNQNKTDKIANGLFKIPGLVSFSVATLKLLDRFGILPRAIIDASPFHTSMFITNMASINMNALHHHLYNFGTTTVFVGLGNKTSKVKLARDGKLTSRKIYPLAVTIDERVCAGAVYGMAFQYLDRYLKNPALLETLPDPADVRYDVGAKYVGRAEKVY
ncbi:MAG: hypothetical protein RR998_06545 [Oscillospiraceae bacterium]